MRLEIEKSLFHLSKAWNKRYITSIWVSQSALINDIGTYYIFFWIRREANFVVHEMVKVAIIQNRAFVVIKILSLLLYVFEACLRDFALITIS